MTQKIEIDAETLAKMVENSNRLTEMFLSGSTVGNAPATRTGRTTQAAKPCKDLSTGIVYRSHSEAGTSVAPEFHLNPLRTSGKLIGRPNGYIWYEVLRLAGSKDGKSTRFVDIIDGVETPIMVGMDVLVTPAAVTNTPAVPQADVVSKSEYDKLKEELNALKELILAEKKPNVVEDKKPEVTSTINKPAEDKKPDVIDPNKKPDVFIDPNKNHLNIPDNKTGIINKK
ncbi:MAG: hypothetical protein PHI12_14210 [Dehalococcoidales bacterium]|nr:hypothetical protein [Dehalococcoidales bacterium]